MKKTFFKITLSVLSMLGLASCLGDSSSYISGEGFAYVTTDGDTYQPILMVLSGYAYPIKTPVLDGSNLSLGDCAYIKFKIYPDNVSGGAYYTDEVTIDDKYFAEDHLRFHTNVIPPVVPETDVINVFDKINLRSASSNEIIKDKWLLAYKTSLQKDQKEAITLYYDSENQPDMEKEGIVYVDLRVTKLDPKDGVKYESSDKTIVADFSTLRSILLGSEPDETSYKIYFRYYVAKVDDSKVTKAVEVKENSGSGLFKEKKS